MLVYNTVTLYFKLIVKLTTIKLYWFKCNLHNVSITPIYIIEGFCRF